MTSVALLSLGVALWFILGRVRFGARARRRELDRLFQRESALRSWERMINQDRKFH